MLAGHILQHQMVPLLLHCRLQVIDIDYVNEAMKRMEKGDVHFRFVIDINKSLVL